MQLFNGTGGNIFIAFNNSTLPAEGFAATVSGAGKCTTNRKENKQWNYELPERRALQELSRANKRDERMIIYVTF